MTLAGEDLASMLRLTRDGGKGLQHSFLAPAPPCVRRSSDDDSDEQSQLAMGIEAAACAPWENTVRELQIGKIIMPLRHVMP